MFILLRLILTHQSDDIMYFPHWSMSSYSHPLEAFAPISVFFYCCRSTSVKNAFVGVTCHSGSSFFEYGAARQTMGFVAWLKLFPFEYLNVFSICNVQTRYLRLQRWCHFPNHYFCNYIGLTVMKIHWTKL